MVNFWHALVSKEGSWLRLTEMCNAALTAGIELQRQGEERATKGQLCYACGRHIIAPVTRRSKD